MSDATLDEICLVALAEAFRGDGELLCHPMGPFPVAAGRLARASFEPDLMLTDTIAYAVVGTLPLGTIVGDPAADEGIVVEGYLPFRTVFDQIWAGRRHVVMGASQIDRHGNQNFAAIGDYRKPKPAPRPAGRARQRHQPHHQLLDPQPGPHLRRERRRRVRAGL